MNHQKFYTFVIKNASWLLKSKKLLPKTSRFAYQKSQYNLWLSMFDVL
jgi:hypothetical protein